MPGLLLAGSPIRRPAGRRVCAPNRGLSQLAASFIGFLCQGIRRAPYVSCPRHGAGVRSSSVALGDRCMGVAYRPGPGGPGGQMLLAFLSIFLFSQIYSKMNLRPLQVENRSDQMYSLQIFVSLCGSQGTRVRAPGTGRCGRGRREDRPDGCAPPRPSEQFHDLVFLEVYLPRKEVIQPHVPVRLPCYDFTPLTLHTFDASLPRTGWAGGFGCRRLGWCDGRCVQGPERIHRGMLIRDY